MTAERPPLDLLWLEPAAPGSAARTHLEGTLRRVEVAGLDVRHVYVSEETGLPLWGKLRRILRLSRRIRTEREPGVLVTRWHPFLALSTGPWKRRGGSVVLLVQGNDETVYETYPWFRRVPFSSWLIRRSLEAGDEVLVLNSGLRAWVNSVRGGSRHQAQILDTGVSDRFLKAPRSEPSQPPYALFFGNLASWQGIDYLLEARLSDEWPSAMQLVIVGDGEMRDAVSRAERAGSLKWVGRLTPDELVPLVSRAFVSICPKANTGSMAETTTPFKILESVAAGVPVIATDIPAQRRMVAGGGYGLLVDPEDPSSLARTLGRVLADPALRSSLAGKATDFAPQLAWEAGAEVLRKAIDRAGSRSGPYEDED